MRDKERMNCIMFSLLSKLLYKNTQRNIGGRLPIAKIPQMYHKYTTNIPQKYYKMKYCTTKM